MFPTFAAVILILSPICFLLGWCARASHERIKRERARRWDSFTQKPFFRHTNN